MKRRSKICRRSRRSRRSKTKISERRYGYIVDDKNNKKDRRCENEKGREREDGK